MKNLGTILALALAMVGGIFGYGQLTADTKHTQEKIEEVKEKIEEHEGDIEELEKYSIKQEMLHQETLRMISEMRSERRGERLNIPDIQ